MRVSLALVLVAIAGFSAWLRLRPQQVTNRVYRIGWMLSPPFEVRGADGGPAGISVELVKEAARRRGIALQWVFWANSSESALRSNSVDLWPLITITENRLKWFHISDPYLVHDHCLLVRSDSRFAAIQDLAASTIGISNVSIDAPLLHSVLPDAKPSARPLIRQVLEDTCSGRTDAVFADKYTAITALLDLPDCGGHSLRWIGVPMVRSRLGVGSTFAARAAADQIREEIGTMAQEGQLAAIFGKWGFMSGQDVASIEALIGARRRETRLIATTVLFAILFIVTCWQSIRLVRERNRTRLAEAALRESQARYMQAQKMESIGRLAGGIAHDFNNLLTVINGYASVITGKLHGSDPLRHHVDEIRKAGERAAELTQQLLVFGRKQMTHPRPLDINAIVQDSEKMFRRLVGEEIEVTTRLSPDSLLILADSGQIHQLLMNLVVNARDAMAGGGRLSIETHSVNVGAKETISPDAIPGPAVALTISDTGKGMDEHTKEHMFEPFFTTKGVGKGTGLGLATVYAIVRQCGGWINVQSEPGRGSTFQVCFPRTEGGGTELAAEAPAEISSSGTETVLVVEDEQEVRGFAVSALATFGYRVLEASGGAEAVALASRHPGPIDLLVTDVVMPGMNGRELADRLVALRPELRVLYTSGYTDDVITQRGVLHGDMAYLAKPYTAGSLASKIREVLHPAG